MHFTSALLASFLSASALALPQTTVQPGGESLWQIENYQEGCSPGGCTYNFDISSTDANPSFGGAFSTHCTGTRSTESPSTNCTNAQFSSSSQVVESEGAILFVTRLFPFGDETDVAGGNVTTAAPGGTSGQSFVMRAHVFGQLGQWNSGVWLYAVSWAAEEKMRKFYRIEATWGHYYCLILVKISSKFSVFWNWYPNLLSSDFYKPTRYSYLSTHQLCLLQTWRSWALKNCHLFFQNGNYFSPFLLRKSTTSTLIPWG